MSVDLWWFRVSTIKVLDGDTIRFLLDNGLGSRQQEDIRLQDVGAPESGQPGGSETKLYVEDWLTAWAVTKDFRWPFLVQTQPNTNPEPTERRSFVRYIGRVFPVISYNPGGGGEVTFGRELNADIRSFLSTHPEWGSGA